MTTGEYIWSTKTTNRGALHVYSTTTTLTTLAASASSNAARAAASDGYFL
jgi:hypothetical protein